MTPPNTFRLTLPVLLDDCPAQREQTLDVPYVFLESLLPMLVGMEWAAIFDQRGDSAATAGELRVAAKAAENLAAQLATLRDRADVLAEKRRADYLIA